MRALFAVCLLALTSSTYAQTSADDQQLDEIIAERWQFSLRESPTFATSVGVNDYNDRLPVVTREAQLNRMAEERRYLRRLGDIEFDELSETSRANADVFRWVVQDSIDAYELNLSRIPFNTFSGFYMNALTASNNVSMTSKQDYLDYIARMQDIPRYFDENIENMREGVRSGFVLPQIVIDGVLPTISAQVKEVAQDSSFYKPFSRMSDRIDDATQQELRVTGIAVIQQEVLPAFAGLASFLQHEYEASESIGAQELADGQAYYAFNIRRYTTIPDATAARIHETGLEEVKRIRAEMEAIIEALEFDGDFAAFGKFLRTDPQFFAASEEQLLKEAAYIAKRIDYAMPGFFGKLPRQPYGIIPVPHEIAPNYATGAYYGAPLGSDHGGAFWINTYQLEQRPLNEIPSLALHEASPGHHHQNALALELEDVPAFRRNLYFSAFGEGWGLYAEKLGVEMGIYQTPYEHFGRLTYEMWRACRLVVDTGMHSQGWTRREALDYFFANTTLSEGNIRAEVDRYISWPGQALAYKLGELKIWELRRIAEHDLGDKFDLREFHDVVLGNGAVPLAMLEREVLLWIESNSQQAD